MMTPDAAPRASTLGARLKEARLATALRKQRTLSQAAMAELVGQAMRATLWQQQWSQYEADASEAPLGVILAAAQLSGLDPCYIAFGPKPETPAPDKVMDVPSPTDRTIAVMKSSTSSRAKAGGKRPKRD